MNLVKIKSRIKKGKKRKMILKNGKIYAMNGGKIIENGFIEFNEKIEKIGDMADFDKKNENEETIDLKGAFVFPGFIDAHTHLGMFEDSLGFEGDDGNEETDPVTPHLRAIDAVNPTDNYFKEALFSGITTVATGPGSANPISGSFLVMKTAGNIIDDMVIKENAAMKFAFGENPKTVYRGKDRQPATRMATAALIREQLAKATEYKEALESFEKNSDEYEKPEYDIKCEALLPLLRKEVPMKAHAHRSDDIMTAIRIAKEFDINLTIEHATEGHLIASRLSQEGISCNLGPTLSDRSKPELKNMTFEIYGILEKAGVNVSIITDHPETPVNFLPLCASLAVKYGMSEQGALEAITINPARTLGISDRVGSLEVGKDADVAIFDKIPLDIFAKTKYVFINGEKIYEQ